MDLSFDDIQIDGTEYFNDIALDYLNEINELKDEVDACSRKLVIESMIRTTSHKRWQKQNEEIIKLQSDIIERDAEISILKSKIRELSTRDPSKLQPPSRFTSKFVDPDEISFRTRALLVQIHQDQEDFLKLGVHENIDGRIAEVRDLFNLLLQQLNDLNKKNKAVTRTLDALAKLDKSESTLRTIKKAEIKKMSEIKFTS